LKPHEKKKRKADFFALFLGMRIIPWETTQQPRQHFKEVWTKTQTTQGLNKVSKAHKHAHQPRLRHRLYPAILEVGLVEVSRTLQISQGCSVEGVRGRVVLVLVQGVQVGCPTWRA
jgi:hypothetical protein